MERGLSIVLAGHTETERGYLPVLKKKIEEKMAGVRVVVSGKDRAPMVVV
jgi:putative NIF3 family GTP cyclohydrolase 1 type 2